MSEKLSQDALKVLAATFAENSTVQIPISIIKQVIEIRNWVSKELDLSSKKS